MKQKVIAVLHWFFALVFSAIGLVNCFVGNDLEFGIFILLLSLLLYPPVQKVFQKMTSWTIPPIALLGLGLFILWASLGVGELMNKLQMMWD